MSFDQEDEAVATAEALDAAGHEVAIITERFAGEDDDEAIVFVVATTAPAQEAHRLAVGDYFAE